MKPSMTAAETIKHFSIGRLVLLQSMWKEIIGGSNLEKRKKHPETQKGKNVHMFDILLNSYSLLIANSSLLVILSIGYTSDLSERTSRTKNLIFVKTKNVPEDLECKQSP